MKTPARKTLALTATLCLLLSMGGTPHARAEVTALNTATAEPAAAGSVLSKKNVIDLRNYWTPKTFKVKMAGKTRKVKLVFKPCKGSECDGGKSLLYIDSKLVKTRQECGECAAPEIQLAKISAKETLISYQQLTGDGGGMDYSDVGIWRFNGKKLVKVANLAKKFNAYELALTAAGGGKLTVRHDTMTSDTYKSVTFKYAKGKLKKTG
jgi:hypothetical protein